MKKAHQIQARVFSKEFENEQEIMEALKSLFPFNLDEEKIPIKKERAIGFKEKQIVIFTITLNKEKHTTKFLNHLTGHLSQEQKKVLIEQKESRLDAMQDFFVRLDKKKLMKDNNWAITDSGNCFHIKINIASFPKNRENALKVIDSLFR